MIEYNNKKKYELYDILQESVTIGLGGAASVISELVDSHVELSTAKLYTVDMVNELPMSSEKLIIMQVEGDILHGETVFSMKDDQLIQLIKHLEGFDEINMENDEIMEIIEDTYLEIGNIILGNVISSMVDFFDIRANINVPYLIHKDEIKPSTENKILVVDVVFNIEKLDASGKLYLLNDYESYMKLLKWASDNF